MVLIASEEKHIIIFDASNRGRSSPTPLIVMILAAAESVTVPLIALKIARIKLQSAQDQVSDLAVIINV